jgi:hypothetical protein
MQYKRFEDLPVWQDAAELARSMYECTSLEPSVGIPAFAIN